MAFNAGRLSEYSMDQLVKMEKEASAKGRKSRVDELRWAITYKLAEARAQSGNPVPTNGYSGRNAKRR